MSRKTDLISEINSLVNQINEDIKELERTGYSKSSFAYDKLEQLRFDNMSYINQKGYFKKASSKMNISQLESELKNLNKLQGYSSLKVRNIEKNTLKAWKSFNKSFKEETGRTRGITQREYAKLRYDFSQWRKSNLSEIMGSDMIVSLSKKTSAKEFHDLVNFANNHDENETIIYINDLKRKHKLQ